MTMELNFIENFGTVFLYEVFVNGQKSAAVLYDVSDGDMGMSTFTDDNISEARVRYLVEKHTRILVEHDGAPGVVLKSGVYYWR